MNSGFPEFGKWLYDSNKKPSLWLNRKIKGKLICEPINIIIEDSFSRTPEESKELLYTSLQKAGFKIMWGHITPRYAIINGIFYNQLPEKFFNAFSDRIWIFENNHARFFGPVRHGDSYYFCGAVSKETGITHKYISFTEARDKYSQMLDKYSDIKIKGFITMDNLLDTESTTTGDHDGNAVLMSNKKKLF
jgi:hypothetical protein